jgi:hypothetical protein
MELSDQMAEKVPFANGRMTRRKDYLCLRLLTSRSWHFQDCWNFGELLALTINRKVILLAQFGCCVRWRAIGRWLSEKGDEAIPSISAKIDLTKAI